MIKINHIYGTKNDYFIVILRNSKYKCYELYRGGLHDLQNFDNLLKDGNPIFAFDFLHDARHRARKIINGEDFKEFCQMDKKLILNALRTLYLMALELRSVVNSLEKAIDLKNLKK